MRCVPLVLLVALAACGGGHKKVEKPVETVAVKPPPPPETEADRQAKRHAQAIQIIPEGSTCLPTSLKEDGAPRLELGAEGAEAVVCANDTDGTRLLGPVACWNVDLSNGSLTYTDAKPLPGRSIDVRLDGKCARGYCLPADAKIEGKIARLTWSFDGSKVAVLAGDEVHLFDAASKAHESSFSVRGDKGVTGDPIALAYVGDEIFVEGADAGTPSGVWVFKSDGTAVGPITQIGAKGDTPISPDHGAFLVLDKGRIGIAERGYQTLSTYDIDTGRRGKLVRKVPKTYCKPAEVDAYWSGGDKVSDRCRASMDKAYAPLVGATTIAGSKNFLSLLRGPRLGELAVLDAKTLVEKKVIKMPWCSDKDKGDGSVAQPTDTGAAAGGKSKGKSSP